MWVLIVLFCILLLLLTYLDIKKPSNFPPGPAWIPILGSALEISKYRQKTGFLNKALYEIAKNYGPVVGFKVGNDIQISIHGYEATKEMLLNEDFSGRPIGPFFDTRTFGLRRGIMFTDEHFWQEQRRFVIRQLKEFGFGRRDMGEIAAEEAEDLVNSIKKMAENTSGIVKMEDLFNVSVLNTLWYMLTGTRYSPEDQKLRNLQGMLARLMKKMDLVGCLFGQFPFLRYIAPEKSGYNDYIKTHVPIWKFLKDEIEKHKANFKPGDVRDFIDVYLETLYSSGTKDSFSEVQLLSICLDLFIAGSETTSKSLAFGFFYLLLNPEVQRKAQEEIDQVVGRERTLVLADRVNLPYIEAIVYESIRVFGGHSLILPHRALKDTTLQGYHIPKNSLMVANFYDLLMTDEMWDRPHEFQPERFLKDGRVHLPEHFLIFGLGKRKCLGQTLALASMFLCIGSLLQKFNFSVPPGELPPPVEFVDGVTPSTKPFNALVTLR